MTGVVKLVPVANAMSPVDVANQEIVPADAVAPKVTVPDPTLVPGVVPVIVGKALTVTIAVLFTPMVVLQLYGDVPPLISFVIVIVVAPAVANALVVKLPVPALATIMEAVLPVAVFVPVKL